MKTFYITTTLPYVNAEPHIGFALEINAADILARYHRQLGERVTFNTGTDEHGQKIYQKAIENNQTPQEYTDVYAAKFDQLKELLNLSYDRFIRTTDANHVAAAQEFWKRCQANGDIYKKLYAVKYCIGCELEKTDSELVDGKCPLHPNRELEIREEENYFFRFSNYQEKLLNLYSSSPDYVVPQGKLNEIVGFVQQGLQDFSISRLKEKMPWGVEVPGDDEHVMYVWFDALVNYISTLSWPDESADFKDFWPGIQIAGKDNLRQQSAMWQAMLMSAGVANSKQILINGFISVDGQKMSKSLGNVISPTDLVDRYGIDGARFILTSIGPVGSDMDVSWEKFDTLFTAGLSNGLGNLVSRVAALCSKTDISFEQSSKLEFSKSVTQALESYQLNVALEHIWRFIRETDLIIEDKQPWKQSGEELEKTLVVLVERIRQIAFELQPFLPETADTISQHFQGPEIGKIKPLFPRLEEKN